MVRYAQQRAMLFSAILRFPPDGYKDIDEFLVAMPEGRNMLNRWIEEEDIFYSK